MSQRASRKAVQAVPPPSAAPVVLVVGELAERDRAMAGPEMAGPEPVHFATFHEIDAPLMATLNPDLILAPVVATEFDCYELGIVLAALGYAGRYRVLALPFCDPCMLQRELCAACGSLDVAVLREERPGPVLVG
jgi:hypothetical protein